MSPAGVVQVVVPAGVADPLRPSGGNTYDRRLCEALGEAGWCVRVTEVAGSWPWAAEADRDALDRVLRAVPDGSLVLVDGLVASALPRVVVPAGRRLRVVLLVHMPIGGDGERESLAAEAEVLGAAAAVLTPSAWCRTWLLSTYGLDPGRVHVAHPGVDVAGPGTGSRSGGALLCVAAVTPAKGHDLLLAALTEVADLPWRCTCVGALTVAPDFVAALRRSARARGRLAGRFLLVGPRTGRTLAAAYAGADVLVLASRAETYGMVVTEALSHGLPVIAADVGGVPEALGATAGDPRPGLLVPPGDVTALADALRRWLTEADLRGDLRAGALRRRAGLESWSATATSVGRVLAGAVS